MSTKIPIVRVGLGQDSHRFLQEEGTKPCLLGGVVLEGVPGFKANSDGDVVFHAICNAISSLTHILILGGVADQLCLEGGITDSRAYLEKALETLGSQTITHVSISIEGKKPHLKEKLPAIRASVASAMKLDSKQVGITATTGEGLTDFGLGFGVQVLALVTTVEMSS